MFKTQNFIFFHSHPFYPQAHLKQQKTVDLPSIITIFVNTILVNADTWARNPNPHWFISFSVPTSHLIGNQGLLVVPSKWLLNLSPPLHYHNLWLMWPSSSLQYRFEDFNFSVFQSILYNYIISIFCLASFKVCPFNIEILYTSSFTTQILCFLPLSDPFSLLHAATSLPHNARPSSRPCGH